MEASRSSKWSRRADAVVGLSGDVRPGEGVVALSMAALFFLVIGSYYLIKPVRNSLFVDRVGADNLPFVYIGTAIVVGLIISWYSRSVVDRVRPKRLILGTYVFLAANLVVFWWWLRYESLISSGVFYIWVKLYILLVVSQFWLVASVLFESRQAKRLYGFVGAGGIVGGIVGGSLAGATVKLVGTENILLAAAVVIALCGFFAMRMHPGGSASGARDDDAASDERRGDRKSVARLVKDTPHLRAIAVILGLTIVVSTVVDWQMNKAVELFVPGEDAKTAFFGWFFAGLSGASLLVQLLLTSYVLRRFGIGIALLLLPVGLALGAVGILLHPGLWTATLAKGAEGTLRYSLDQSTRELLYLPVAEELKIRAKPFIDVAVYRGGTGVGGIAVLLAAKVFDIPFQYMSFFSIGAIGLWIAVTFVMRREYVSSIKRRIQARDVEVEELVVGHLDADSRRELTDALESEEPQRVLYALELLDLAGDVEAEDRMTRLLRHADYEVRERAAAALARQGDAVLLEAAQALLEADDIEVRAEAVRLVCKHCEGDELRNFQRLFSDPRPRVRAGAIASYYETTDPQLRQAAEEALWSLALHPGPEGAVYRREAALLAAVLPPTEATRGVLNALLDDAHEEVRRAAIAAAGRVRERGTLPVLIEALSSPRVREHAREALAAYGEEGAEALAERLRDPSTRHEIRTQVARALADFPVTRSVEALTERLDDPDPGLRYHVLKTLNRLRRQRPELSVDPERVERGLRRELEMLENLRAIRSGLEDLRSPNGPGLWERVVNEREMDAVERITRFLGLVYPLSDMFHAYRALATPGAQNLARGIELLDNVLKPRHRKAVVPALEKLEIPGRNGASGPPPPLEEFDSWLAACVAYAQGGRPGDGKRTEEGSEMMTIVERADHLRQVMMFSDVRTDALAKLAAIAEERSLEPETVLFEQGRPLDGIYFVVEGEIRAIRDGDELWVARPGDAVGALAVLDREPTLIRAVASEPSRVLFVRDEEFFDLVLDSQSATLGIFRYLAGEVRRLATETSARVSQYS